MEGSPLPKIPTLTHSLIPKIQSLLIYLLDLEFSLSLKSPPIKIQLPLEEATLGTVDGQLKAKKEGKEALEESDKRKGVQTYSVCYH